MTEPWVDTALRRLPDTRSCPACAATLTSTRCDRCLLRIDGPLAFEVARASMQAAEALARRQQALDALRAAQPDAGARVPRPQPRQVPVRVGAPAMPRYVSAPLPAPGPAVARPVPRAVGLQPILAGAGASLLAVAAVVFVFFTFADDLVLRAAVTGVVTLLTFGVAAGLRRGGLRSSAEAVAALAVVLVLVDIELALQAGLLAALEPAAARAILLAAVAVGLGVLGDRTRMRGWVTCALVLAPVVPLVAAAAAGTAWAVSLGLLGVALVTLVAGQVTRRSGPRVGSGLVGERRLLRVVRLVAVPAAAAVALAAPAVPGLPGSSGAALLVLAAAATAGLLRVVTHERAWLGLGGAGVALSAGLLGVGAAWGIGAVPAAAAVGWLLLVVVSARRVSGLFRVLVRGRGPLAPSSRARVLLGGWVVAAFLSLGALLGLPLRVLDVLTGVVTAGTTPTLDAGLLDAELLDAGLLDTGILGAGTGAAHLGVLALVVVAVMASRLGVVVADRPAPVVVAGRRIAPWAVLTLVLGLVLDPRLLLLTTVVLLVVLASALVLATSRPVADPSGSGRLVRAARRAAGRVVRPVARACAPLATTVQRHGATPVTVTERTHWRAAAVTGASLAVALLALVSWSARPTATAGGAVVALLLLGARAAVPRVVRPVLVGTADAYALVVLGATLAWSGLSGVAVLCSVSAVASLVALSATVLRRLDRDSWWAVLAVTAVPFALGVATVVVERSWWSVAACAAMLALEVVLVVTARTGSAAPLRALAAALVLPTASVGVVSTGALLLPGSGSPVVLPVVALLVAVAAAGAAPLAQALAPTGPAPGGVGVRSALEASAVLTAAIAVGLSYARAAAGPDVAVPVLLLLAVGAGIVARERDRAGVWWASAALATAATWTALGAAGVSVVEAYTAPPGVAALVVGVLLARRTSRGWDLATAGLLLLVVPSLLVLWAAPGAQDVRAPLLLLGGALAVLAAAALLRWRPEGGTRARTGARRLSGAALLAALAGTVEAVHVGHVAGGGALFALGLAWSLAAGAVAFGASTTAVGAARVVRRAAWRRWALAPSLVLVVVGVVANVRPVWGVIAAVWVTEVLLLALVVVGVRRAVRGVVDVPPAWFTWLLALAAAIGAWTPRELRVEVFSMPLGVGLLVAGYVAFAASRDDSPAAVPALARASGRWGSWPFRPGGRMSSWWTLAPGILATLGPSVLATYTDARTWRAILVVAIALAAVLVGTRMHLAAPFVLGVAVLPVEILIVFVSQLGTAISAGPWMLTLAAAGGVMLIIATYYERRIAAYDGAAAYLRDLR
ncbi:hypothetical protein IF650_05955 [Cellulosimicrobium terreum]|nr:hypothetical protein [Cellulosimicrobium terreum]